MSMKNSNDTIGYRTRNLPACSAVPQPTAPPRGPNKYSMSILIIFWSLKCGHLPHITLLPHRNLRWLLDFWKIFTPPNLRRNVSKFKKIVSQKNEVSSTSFTLHLQYQSLLESVMIVLEVKHEDRCSSHSVYLFHALCICIE